MIACSLKIPSISTFRSWRRSACSLVLGVQLLVPAVAHEDILEQINALDARMAKGGESAELLLRRAHLHLVHEDWKTALSDYKRVHALSPKSRAAELGMAKAHLGAGELESGLERVESFLKAAPEDADGILVRARLRAATGDFRGASHDYQRAVAELKNRASSIYYEWASALKRAGKAHSKTALATIDAGIAALGTNVALQELGIEIDLEAGNYNAAIIRIDSLLDGPLKNSPKLLVLRAETLAHAGRQDDADEAFEKALAGIRGLPIRRQRVAAIRKLVARIEAGRSSRNTNETTTNP